MQQLVLAVAERTQTKLGPLLLLLPLLLQCSASARLLRVMVNCAGSCTLPLWVFSAAWGNAVAADPLRKVCQMRSTLMVGNQMQRHSP
jgi:hypothetical protein